MTPQIAIDENVQPERRGKSVGDAGLAKGKGLKVK